MFSWIINASLQFRVLVLGAAAVLVVFGIYQLRDMPIDVFPEFAAPTVEVQTEALGLSAEEVEGLVTLNLEELLSGVPWLESIRSKSVTGLSSIVLTFERGTDLIKTRQMVQERLTLAYTLPNVAKPPAMLQPVSATRRVVMVGISSEKVEPTELSLLARWTIKPKLLGVPGVANVAIWGQRLRQLHVQIDPARLRDARLLQGDIIEAAGDALWMTPLTFLKGSMPGAGGWIDNPNQRLGVHHEMPITRPEDMAKVSLAPVHLLMTGKSMSLGDVTEVTFDHPLLIGDAFVNNGRGLLIVIEKLPSANTVEVTRGVQMALDELSRGLPGVNIDTTVFQLSSYIKDSLFNLSRAIVIGALLLVLTLGAFLLNWRSALISVASIALSLLVALVVLELSGATMNTMILAGLVLALAILIDDAVVDVEKLMRRLRARHEGGGSVGTVIYQTILETRSTTIYATLIVLLSLTPIFFMGGVSGAFFEPMALSYLLAVMASTVVGLTVTPALSFMLFGKAQRGVHPSPMEVRLGNRFRDILEGVARVPETLFASALVLVTVGLGLWPLLGKSLLPALKEQTVQVNWTTPPGTSAAETYRIMSRVSRELQSLPGVRNVAAHAGRAITGDQVVGINSSEIWVSIDPDSDYDETIASIRETIRGYPGIDRSLRAYLRDTVSEVLTGASAPVVVRIYGQDLGVLREKAEEVRQAISSIDGLFDVRTVGQVEEPQVRVAVNLEAARRAAVKPGDVRRSAATVFSGLTVGFLFENQKIYDVVVWGAPETRNSLDDIRNVWVEKSNRHLVRLGDVADLSIEPTPTMIQHDSISPYMDVVAHVSGRDLSAINQEIEDRLRSVEFPLEYHPKVLGEYAEQLSTQQRVLWVFIATLIGIFLLLQACFRSWSLALIGFLALPAGMAGSVLAVLVTGGVAHLGSIVGFLAVLGIAARNGILLIKRYQTLEKQDGARFGLDLVLGGTGERLLPILASSIGIIVALLPMVVFGRIAGLEIPQSTAMVIIGGVIASALFTLLVLPVAYLRFGSGSGEKDDLGLSGV